MDPQVNFYYNIYKSQTGGESHVFRGAKYMQYGSGFGDILRCLYRHVLPVAAKGTATFLTEVASNRHQGLDWNESVKNAIVPTVTSVISESVNQVRQRGGAKQRRRKRRKAPKRRVYKGKRKRANKRKIQVPNSFAKIPKFNF